MRPPLLRWMRRASLAGDSRGVTIVEFAIVAPVLLFMLVGMFDIGHTLYVTSVLQGVVQKAGRDSSLENGVNAATQEAVDTIVKSQVMKLNNSAKIDITRRFYKSFDAASAARPEDFTDVNLDHICNDGEPFEDANDNNIWDKDGAADGQGGAKDSVVYSVHVSYPRLFPLDKFMNVPETVNITARTIMNNQPYGDQSQYGTPKEGKCP